MEDSRCGRSHDIAKSFGIKVSDTDPFWKDRTFLELNFAVSQTIHRCFMCLMEQVWLKISTTDVLTLAPTSNHHTDVCVPLLAGPNVPRAQHCCASLKMNFSFVF